MSKYQRQHKGPNLSRGMMWILGLGVVAYIIYKVVVYRQKIKEVEQIEMYGTEPERDHEIMNIEPADTSFTAVDTMWMK
jgi:hypothetical protein